MVERKDLFAPIKVGAYTLPDRLLLRRLTLVEIQ